MDRLDRKILNIAQKDGRIAYAEIGRQVGLSITAVKDRLDKLSSKGVLQHYSVVVAPQNVGYSVLAYVFVAIDDVQSFEGFEKSMIEIPYVQECHHVTGNFNYSLKVLARDLDHLEDLLITRIKMPGIVSRTETTVVLSSVKNTGFVDCVSAEVE
ncbi:Lrp/AsnC family transcriptional regulator [Sneathiella aquimaris]|uniref:Lrp/AsnC family transcriptional regulator n=1 Tax=Sneathiella aquimaris TaxID=2599305 RepID=UPI00146EC701|nr:Lrp/AsnC family transcriptional regulator [Sneathiella aquimaris]